MSILPIFTYPNQLLRTKCNPVSSIDVKTLKLINDMIETMYSFVGCIGISAPQVGKLFQIITVDVSKHKKVPINNHGLITLINPVIIDKNGKTISREGCLSIPDYTGNVERVNRIKIKGKDINGKRLEFYSDGIEAIAIQHEIDHLEGILFIDRISSLKTDLFVRKSYLRAKVKNTFCGGK